LEVKVEVVKQQEETTPTQSPNTSTGNTPKESFLEPTNEKYKSGKNLETIRIQSIDIEKNEEKRDSKSKTRMKTSKLTIDDEFDVLLSAIHVYLKKPEKRSPEESAYIIAMKKFTEKLIEHCKKSGGKPEFSLAGGTYILCKEECDRSIEEKEFVHAMFEEYNREVKDTKVFTISPEVQLDIITQAKKAFEDTKLYPEYIKRVKMLRNRFKLMASRHGLVPMYSMVSGSTILAKYENEISQQDLEFLQELGKL
jgi:hypothetical protein